jgi:ATP-dependent Zn protease
MLSQFKKTFKNFFKILFISFAIFGICLGYISKIDNLSNKKVYRKFWENCGLFEYKKNYTHIMNKTISIKTAYHEAGHALVAALLKATIKSVTIFTKKINPFLYKEGGLTEMSIFPIYDNLIKIFLAGYAVEKIIFKTTDNGFEDDLDKASNIAFIKNEEYSHNNQTPAEILEEDLNAVTKMINQNINKLHAIANALSKTKKLTGDEVVYLVQTIKN